MPLHQVPLGDQGGGFRFVIVPLTTQDIRGLKKELPPYLDDPIGVGEKIEEYLGNEDYTWKDWDFLLGILFGSSEKRMILQKAWQLWEDERPQGAEGAGPNVPTVDDAIPQVDPHWNPNEETSLARLRDYCAYLIRAIKSAVPRTNNIAKAMSLEQEKHESPSHWLERIRGALRKHGGMDPEGPSFDTLLKVQFVKKAWPDVQKEVQKDEEWQNKPLEELVRKTQQIYVKRDEEKLLGRDLMAEVGMQISIVKNDIESNTVISLRKMFEKAYAEINPEVWAAPGRYRKLDIEPLQITLKQPGQVVSKKQYPLSREGKKGLQPVIESLLKAGLLELCMSPYNTPILPVKKPDRTYTMVQDLRIINEIVKSKHPTVPDRYTILNQIPSSHQYYSVQDLKDAFWGCPITEDSKQHFAFE
ncbi:hypothetical protein DUI87_00912 [Hirundo rustica rustica]|uniref:Core shell protein Gag P30 domain-containing protein n=1 Tax=Hirundo rustica rustica TaxID=333673 RepID=A0A3M0L4N1_HIRRU|nr:hypothetical protein DUI87_00912 [Hirundo rustica rustica]